MFSFLYHCQVFYWTWLHIWVTRQVPSWAHEFTSFFLVGSVLLIFLVLCTVLLCVFTFWVPCCTVCYDFRILVNNDVRFVFNYLQLFVQVLMSYLRYLCLFGIAVSNTYYVCCFGSVFLVLCTICCQFLWIVTLIASSVFSNIYFLNLIHNIFNLCDTEVAICILVILVL